MIDHISVETRRADGEEKYIVTLPSGMVRKYSSVWEGKKDAAYHLLLEYGLLTDNMDLESELNSLLDAIRTLQKVELVELEKLEEVELPEEVYRAAKEEILGAVTRRLEGRISNLGTETDIYKKAGEDIAKAATKKIMDDILDLIS